MDSAYIQNLIDNAGKGGTVRISAVNPRTGTNEYRIEKTLVLPSDIEIIVDGAKLVQETGTFCNMFATANYMNRTREQMQNITIRGENGAVLDGGEYNGLCEWNSGKDGRPSIHVNTMMMFYNVSGLVVENLKIVNQRWWAVTNMYVDHARYSNIDFKADISRIDENGVHYPNELPRNYKEIYIKNADGIDLRLGCHDFVIEDITGFTEDDSVALTALNGGWIEWLPEGKNTHIHDVIIRRVATDCYTCANIRLLCEEGNQIYNVTVDGVTDTRTDEHYKSHSTVRIGDRAYGKVSSQMGDIRNITVTNIISHGNRGVSLCKTLQNSEISHIKADGEPFSVYCFAEMERVKIIP